MKTLEQELYGEQGIVVVGLIYPFLIGEIAN